MERSQLIAVLGTSDQPNTAEVRRARRLVARRLHPDADAGLDPDVMSQINAACDEWIQEIRAQRNRPDPVPDAEPAANPPANHATTNHATTNHATTNHATNAPESIALPGSYVAATALLLVSIVGVVVLLVGFSATSLAVGGLIGAAAAAVFVLVLYRMARRESRPT